MSASGFAVSASEKYEEIFRANALDAAPHRRPPQAIPAAFLESPAIPTIR
jgi:hypothetical protein